jgi:hypothetical protein
MEYKQEFLGLKVAAGVSTLFTPPIAEHGRYVLHITQAAIARPTRTTHRVGLLVARCLAHSAISVMK